MMKFLPILLVVFYMAMRFGIAHAIANDQPVGATFSGFADVLYQSSSDHSLASGTVLNDSAIYIDYQSPFVSSRLDLPFYFEQTEVERYNVGIKAEKAQFYFNFEPQNSLRIQVGLFDAPFGVEQSDSLDSLIAVPGIVSMEYGPNSELGGLGTYMGQDDQISVLVADQSHIVHSRGNEEMKGVQLGLQYSRKTLRNLSWTPGILYTFGPQITQLLYQLMVSYNFKSYQLELETNFVQPLQSTQGDKNKVGLLVLNSVALDSSNSIALRLEYLNELSGEKDIVQMTTGFQHRFHDRFRVRAEYGVNTHQSHILRLGTVLSLN